MADNETSEIINKERRFKKRYTIGLTLLTLLTGWVGTFVMLRYFPEHYVKGFPWISVFFYFWGILFVSLMSISRGKKLTLLILGIKIARLLLFVLLCGLYVTLVNDHNLDFVVTGLIFYLIYLTFDTICVWSYGRTKGKVKN